MLFIGIKNQNDLARFIIKIKTTPAGEVAEKLYQKLVMNKINEEAIYDGFYAVCTTLEDDVADIIKINRRRWKTEELCRIMKSEFKARPIYLGMMIKLLLTFWQYYVENNKITMLSLCF